MSISTTFRYDQLETGNDLVQDDHGDYVISATISKVGVFNYRNADGLLRREYRPVDEVLKQASLESMSLAPVTRGHPSSMRVDSKSSHLRVGLVKPGVRPDFTAGTVDADLIIHSDEALDAIRAGEKAISPGYTCSLDETPGEWQGQPYDAIQKNIRVNHIALLKLGTNRQGPDVRVHMDGQDLADPDNYVMVQVIDGADAPEENIMAETVEVRVLHIDGADHKVPVAVADAYDNEIKKLVDRADSAEGQVQSLTAALAQATDPKVIGDKVAQRVALIATVERLTCDKADVLASDRDLQAKVICAFDAKLDISNRSDAFVAAAFEIASNQLASRRADGVGQLGAALAPHGQIKINEATDEAAARQRMIERQHNLARS
jgi:uncharacterized protein